MIFKEHSKIKGQHSFLSASKYHWIRYDELKLEETFINALATQRGNELHAFAAEAIRLRIKIEGTDTVAQYINDAIGFRMNSEQVLYYSQNCFGTADAISYSRGRLRIHDLKTGTNKANMDQLLVYASIFCLEYRVKPSETDIILRIYQNDEIEEYEPLYDEIIPIMEKIVDFDQRIEALKSEVL